MLSLGYSCHPVCHPYASPGYRFFQGSCLLLTILESHLGLCARLHIKHLKICFIIINALDFILFLNIYYVLVNELMCV